MDALHLYIDVTFYNSVHFEKRKICSSGCSIVLFIFVPTGRVQHIRMLCVVVMEVTFVSVKIQCCRSKYLFFLMRPILL